MKRDDQLNIEIIIASVDDVFGISDVQRESWLATYPNKEFDITKEDILTEDFKSPGRIEKRRQIIADQNSNSRFFVAKCDGKVVGYCYAQKLADFNKLKSIYILPEFTGNGIGRRLVQKAFDYFDMSKPVKLNVAIYNTNAISFYKKLGFKEGERHVKNPEGSFLTGKEIPEMEMIKYK